MERQPWSGRPRTYNAEHAERAAQNGLSAGSETSALIVVTGIPTRPAMVTYRCGDRAGGLSPPPFPADGGAAHAGRTMPRPGRGPRPRLRAHRPRRVPDARPHAVSGPPLEREDLRLRTGAIGFRRPAGAAAARESARPGERRGAHGRHGTRR